MVFHRGGNAGRETDPSRMIGETFTKNCLPSEDWNATGHYALAHQAEIIGHGVVLEVPITGPGAGRMGHSGGALHLTGLRFGCEVDG